VGKSAQGVIRCGGTVMPVDICVHDTVSRQPAILFPNKNIAVLHHGFHIRSVAPLLVATQPMVSLLPVNLSILGDKVVQPDPLLFPVGRVQLLLISGASFSLQHLYGDYVISATWKARS